MRLCAFFLLFLCCYADYTKQSYWPNMQCYGVPSQENFLNVGLGGCVSSGDHSTRSLCTNMSYGEARSYSSNDCTGIYSRTPIVFDPACLLDGNYYGLSTLSACVSTDEKNVAPSSAAPNTILYKSYLVDSCNLISPQTLDYFLVLSTSSCIPRSTQISDGYICNSSGVYGAKYSPGCIGQPISTTKGGLKLGCGPDPERNDYFVADISCYSQAQGSSTYSATVLGAGIGGTTMGLGLLAGGVLLWRRRTASAAEHTPLMSS